ncbi:MAG: late control gene D protein [Bacteriophage sp.]|nr:MAG: late control gene D protein [Bacteriophage sp.]
MNTTKRRKRLMSNPRQVAVSLSFNGKRAKTSMANYIKSLTYADVASGSSDSLDLTLHNVDMKWIGSWYPAKGDKVSAKLTFKNWLADGQNKVLSCGSFVLDTVKFSGGPLEATMQGLAIPSNSSFKVRERTKTWKKVTIKQIATEIAKRYKIGLSYVASSIQIASVEQSKKTDSAFLYDLVKDYGLSMKVFRNKIIIFDKGRYEKKKAVATIHRNNFVDDDWDYSDTLEGTYTGCRITYKSASKNQKALSAYVGLKKETAKGSRILRINEQCDSLSEAKRKAAAQINQANEEATVLTGTIFYNPKVVAGVTVNIADLGKANGKYYVDEVRVIISDSATKQEITLHKCKKRLAI